MKTEYKIALILAYLGMFIMFVGALFKVIELKRIIYELDQKVEECNER